MDNLLTWLIGSFLLLFGAALCFIGYRRFRILIPIWTFVAGFWIGEAVIATFFPENAAWIIIGWLVGLIAGLTLAALSFGSHLAGLIILGATFGWWLASGLLAWLQIDQGLVNGLLIILAAIIFAGLTFLESIRRYVVIAYVALVGAGAIASGLLFIVGNLTAETFRNSFTTMSFIWQESGLVTILWVLLAVVGAVVQVVTTREEGEAEEDEFAELLAEEERDEATAETWLVEEEEYQELVEAEPAPESFGTESATIQDESMAEELLQEPLDDEEMITDSFLDEEMPEAEPGEDFDDLYLTGRSDV